MPNELTLSEPEVGIESLCAAGQIDRAVRLAKRSGILPSKVPAPFKMGMQKLFQRDRVNELASVLFKYEDLRPICPIPVSSLLQRMYDLRDYSGFLKQTHRFQMQASFEEQIEASLKALLDSGQIESANAYLLKLASARLPIEEGSTNHSRSVHSSCTLCDSAVTALKRIESAHCGNDCAIVVSSWLARQLSHPSIITAKGFASTFIAHRINSIVCWRWRNTGKSNPFIVKIPKPSRKAEDRLWRQHTARLMLK